MLLTGFIGILVVTLLFFLLLALWYGYRFGTPILHMMNWLEQLSRGHYAQADTRLSSRHRPFASVFEALQHLTKILKDNENMRDKMEKAREEWISGRHP